MTDAPKHRYVCGACGGAIDGLSYDSTPGGNFTVTYTEHHREGCPNAPVGRELLRRMEHVIRPFTPGGQVCPVCDAVGSPPAHAPECRPCAQCRGDGDVPSGITDDGDEMPPKGCPRCGGSGRDPLRTAK